MFFTLSIILQTFHSFIDRMEKRNYNNVRYILSDIHYKVSYGKDDRYGT